MPLSAEKKKTEPEHVSELTVAEALSLAIRTHQTGYLDNAETLYRRILAAVPDQSDALHFLGVLLHQRGRSEEGLAFIRQSIAVDGSNADCCNNLGNVLLEMGRVDAAAAAYERCLALAPANAEVNANLGALRKAQQRFAEAEIHYRKAVELKPEHADFHNNLGNLCSARGRVKEAITHYFKAITLMPRHAHARRLLGIAYYSLGQVDAAAEVYRQWLAEEPDNPMAQHMLAACTGTDVPPRASDSYVETTFDLFADSFDAKLARLEYRAPQLVADALVQAAGVPAKRLSALDAGCGTGLCGPLIAAYTSRLTGVDLSAQMLARAKTRNIYDELVKAELTEYLRGHDAAFDLIVSADTLVYFGPLEPVVEAARGALRSEGRLIFTIEEMTDAGAAGCGYHLNPHGRYSHAPGYLRDTLTGCGFGEVVMEPAALRMEAGSPVRGLVISCRKTAGPRDGAAHSL